MIDKGYVRAMAEADRWYRMAEAANAIGAAFAMVRPPAEAVNVEMGRLREFLAERADHDPAWAVTD